jgi:hypothetical protein
MRVIAAHKHVVYQALLATGQFHARLNTKPFVSPSAY